METKERILATAEELFFRFGIRSVTMDDIAKALGISKKTIYNHFKDKDEIVEEVTETALQKDKNECEQIYLQATDAIDEIMKSTQLMRDMVENMHPGVLFDLQKYYPKAWKRYLNHRNGFIEIVLRNLKKGKEAGLYQEGIDAEILARFRVASIDSAFDESIFPPKRFKLIDVQLQLLNHFLRGILTPQGLKLYENYNKVNHYKHTTI
ncbi:MAG: AcrR family transcriptional regulator [Spirosomataceae bacterium]